MKQFHLPRVYAITDTRLSGLSHTDQVKQLIKAGATFIQLREKHQAPKIFYPDALEAVNIARNNGVKIIVNDRVDIAMALKADGVHVGQDDLPPTEARKLLAPETIIGFSSHSLEQAKAALNEPVDYIAIGPVFGTATKERPDPTVGLQTVRNVRELVGPDFPLVAIGGIDHTNIAAVLAAGADSAAVISCLFSSEEAIS